MVSGFVGPQAQTYFLIQFGMYVVVAQAGIFPGAETLPGGKFGAGIGLFPEGTDVTKIDYRSGSGNTGGTVIDPALIVAHGNDVSRSIATVMVRSEMVEHGERVVQLNVSGVSIRFGDVVTSYFFRVEGPNSLLRNLASDVQTSSVNPQQLAESGLPVFSLDAQNNVVELGGKAPQVPTILSLETLVNINQSTDASGTPIPSNEWLVSTVTNVD